MNPLSVFLCACLLPVLPAQAQLFENLQALTQETPGLGNVKSIVTGDFDKDGHADFAVAGATSATTSPVTVCYGDGAGNFPDRRVIPLPPATTLRQVIVVDLDEDGNPDLVTADPFAGVLLVIRGRGGRSWTVDAAVPAWVGVRNLAAGDFDGDGHMDVAAAGPDLAPAQEDPVPPLPTGVVQFRGAGDGSLTRVANLPETGVFSYATDDGDYSFPRPVYTLEVWRPAGESRDWLAVTHALTNSVWFLAAGVSDTTGHLRVTGQLANTPGGVRAMKIGPVLTAAASGVPDLLLASRDRNTLEVHRGMPGGFDPVAAFRLAIANGPRAISLTDINADGWNDLAVVVRNANRALTFTNEAGVLTLSSEGVTGLSPRDLAAADFDEDGAPDFMVANRYAGSATLLASRPPGGSVSAFRALDQMYATDGDVAQLALYDLTGNGRADVLQLHRSSGEVSVRLSGPAGRLGEPVTWPMGERPAAITIADYNNDGKPDLACAGMGDARGGMITVRYGDGQGGFGGVLTFRPPLDGQSGPMVPAPSLPPGVVASTDYGRLFAVSSTDLDGDGISDLIAGYYDCRIVFFRGTGDGRFIPTDGFSDHEAYFEFGYEARFFGTGDFDQDGDVDIAAVTWTGDAVILENTGNFFLTDKTRPPYRRTAVTRTGNDMARARDVSVTDSNGDGDPDLVIATGKGVQVLEGGPGMTFTRKLFPGETGGPPDLPTVPEATFPVEAMVTGDVSGDGVPDVVTICATDSCLRILTNNGAGYGTALTVHAPPTRYLAAADIDGDGLPDLAGTGSVLWVALSSRVAAPGPAVNGAALASRVPGVVINEILTRNNAVPVPAPSGIGYATGFPDAVELYNGSAAAVSLAGWSLRLTTPDAETPEVKSYAFPADAVLPAGGRQIVLCTRRPEPGNPWITGYNLPKEGGQLCLCEGSAERDRVEYPEVPEGESYARYADGAPGFRVNEWPDIGQANLDNGAAPPRVTLNGVNLAALLSGGPLRFYATATDDVGLTGLIVHYRKRGGTYRKFRQALLLDDGGNGDGGRLDGVFSGIVPELLAPGTVLEFYLQAEDLSGEIRYLPGAPDAADEAGLTDPLYTITLPSAASPLPGLEISELVSNNKNGLSDEGGGTPDWLELRNTSVAPLSLDGVELADALFAGDSRRLFFPPGLTLAPGGYVVIFCDEDASTSGVLHAPFKLSDSGRDEIFLTISRNGGSPEIIDALSLPPLARNEAWARLGVRGAFFRLPPTPGEANVPAGQLIPLTGSRNGVPWFYLAYPTSAGAAVALDTAASPAGPWSRLTLPTGDGVERAFGVPASGRAFFRLAP